MTVFLCLFVLVPLASSIPATPNRIYLPEEEDPNHNLDLVTEGVNLTSGVPQALSEVQLDDVTFELYNTHKTDRRPPYTFNLRTFNDDVFRSYFDASKLTVIVTHGWKNNRHSTLNQLMKNAILHNYDVNLIITDWSSYAGSWNYLTSKAAVPEVGKIVAKLVDKISSLCNLDGQSFVLIGHSLGAHVSGHAGKNVHSRLLHIIGLDPAGPGFSVSDTAGRLSDTDATVVQVIHTNGGKLGMFTSIGTVDFYPNGGRSQPGCGFDALGKCAHSRAYEYLAEALVKGLVFKGYFCSSYESFKAGTCDNNPTAYMGQLVGNHKDVADYFLDTNSMKPYSLGE